MARGRTATVSDMSTPLFHRLTALTATVFLVMGAVFALSADADSFSQAVEKAEERLATAQATAAKTKTTADQAAAAATAAGSKRTEAAGVTNDYKNQFAAAGGALTSIQTMLGNATNNRNAHQANLDIAWAVLGDAEATLERLKAQYPAPRNATQQKKIDNAQDEVGKARWTKEEWRKSTVAFNNEVVAYTASRDNAQAHYNNVATAYNTAAAQLGNAEKSKADADFALATAVANLTSANEQVNVRRAELTTAKAEQAAAQASASEAAKAQAAAAAAKKAQEAAANQSAAQAKKANVAKKQAAAKKKAAQKAAAKARAAAKAAAAKAAAKTKTTATKARTTATTSAATVAKARTTHSAAQDRRSAAEAAAKAARAELIAAQNGAAQAQVRVKKAAKSGNAQLVAAERESLVSFEEQAAAAAAAAGDAEAEVSEAEVAEEQALEQMETTEVLMESAGESADGLEVLAAAAEAADADLTSDPPIVDARLAAAGPSAAGGFNSTWLLLAVFAAGLAVLGFRVGPQLLAARAGRHTAAAGQGYPDTVAAFDAGTGTAQGGFGDWRQEAVPAGRSVVVVLADQDGNVLLTQTANGWEPMSTTAVGNCVAAAHETLSELTGWDLAATPGVETIELTHGDSTVVTVTLPAVQPEIPGGTWGNRDQAAQACPHLPWRQIL